MKGVAIQATSVQHSKVPTVDKNEDFVDIPLEIEMKEADEEMGQSYVKTKSVTLDSDNVKKLPSQDKTNVTSSSENKKYGVLGRFVLFYLGLVLAFTLIPALIFYIIQAPIVFLLRKCLIKEIFDVCFPEGTYESIRGKLLHILKTPFRWLLIACKGEGEIWEPFP